jgi:crotonyl-CoA carboxylase/reductase
MALDTNPAIAAYDAPKKDLYEMGEIPPMGHVPPKMYAWAIRRERHGEPDKACRSRSSTPGNSTATRCWFS